MNIGMLTQMLGRVSERTKLIAVAIVGFLAGMLLTGHGSDSANGRYVPWGTNQVRLLDTQTGRVWVLNEQTRRFERWAAIPYF